VWGVLFQQRTLLSSRHCEQRDQPPQSKTSIIRHLEFAGMVDRLIAGYRQQFIDRCLAKDTEL